MTRRSRRALAATAVALALCALGCRQEMYDQPKYKPLGASEFFADGRASRPLVEGTVARGFLRPAAVVPEAQATVLPMPLTRELLARGRERYEIFCTPCHDRTGNGLGMVVRRGYRPPPTLHLDRLREAPVGHLYDVMTRGLGAMPDYAQQISPDDRWAIAAYVKALQLAQRATVSDVRPEDLPKLEAREAGGKPETKPEPAH